MSTFSELIQTEQQEGAGTTDTVIKGLFRITKSDDSKRLAFGWANVAANEQGEILQDWQGDLIEAAVLEQAAYNFVRLYRDGGEMHERGGCAELVESVVFTKEKMAAIGIPEGVLPEGWWIGFYVTDDDVWEKVKSGQYSMFSIEGEAIREETTETGNTDGITQTA
ncbi:MAG: hypothetical protein IJ709_06345 [Selenomonas sp.]|nr:hypothetical protein [Selenomonas sp.]